MITVMIMGIFRRTRFASLAGALGLALAGLSGSPSAVAGASSAATATPVVRVVAAENFWGNITSQLGRATCASPP